MIKIGLFDAKPYDRASFEDAKTPALEIRYFENKLNADTAPMAAGLDVVCAFVNDTLDKETIETLANLGVKLIALRCAGYNNVNFHAAYGKINVVRVPGYSPHAVAEHAMALLLSLNRKIHKAYARTREHNFSLAGLTGFDLYGKTAGVIGTGKIGQAFIQICKGFGMHILAYDPYPNEGLGVEYVSLERLLSESDIVSLHCPLTEETRHILNAPHLALMKKDAMLVNTSRGALVDSRALLEALRTGHLGAAALDVYEEESEFFFEDHSESIMPDETLTLLLTLPNVLVTSHQGFLTREALRNIAETTIQNIEGFFDGAPLPNEICYYCLKGGRSDDCKKAKNGRCF